jgi:myo-inositol-1(or 4)-monophosphatase
MNTTLREALLAAGKIQKENFSKAHEISIKESISSIVTEVDLASEKRIMELIRKSFPNHNLLGEESGLIDNRSDYTWVIDPLDGTSNYAAGIPWFGVLIAVFKGKEPVLSGAYLPMQDILYFAEKGKGCFINGNKAALQTVTLHESLFAFSTDFTADEYELEAGIAWYRYVLKNVRNVRSTNSLVDMMLVLEGKLGGCINMFTKIWDIAAPYLLLKEAGGVMKGLNGSSLEFDLSSKGLKKNYPIICGSEHLVANLLEGFKK